MALPTLHAQTTPPDGAALFSELCARCHGVNGDGTGPEVLDRPARDFTAGGFSFGNTETALVRTIGNGIPGSPMPAFGETTSRDKLEALARHVLTLAPPQPEATEAETIVVVDEHPVVLRGGLPPIADGAAAHPRGLLLGLPDGLTFEYRVPDLALLGVRAGEFARRTDWTGRGGTPIQPLGVVIWLNERGDPRQQVGRLDDQGAWHRATAELRATRTPAPGALIEWDALADDGSLIARVSERPRALITALGSGFARELTLSERHGPLVLRQGVSPGEPLATIDLPGLVVRRDDGSIELAVVLAQRASVRVSGAADRLEVVVDDADGDATITFATLLLGEDTPPDEAALRAAIEEGLAR